MKLYLTVIFLVCNVFVQGQNVTNLSSLNHKMSREEYLSYFKGDSVSENLINFYFDQRKHGAMLMSLVPLNIAAVVITPIALASPILTVPCAVAGGIKRNKWNRKKLFNALISYNQGNPLPDKMVKKLASTGYYNLSEQ